MKHIHPLVLATSSALALVSHSAAQTAPFIISNVRAESLGNINDLNGDQYRELVIGQPSLDRVDFYDGKSPTILRTYTGATGSRFGAAVTNYGPWSSSGSPLDALVVGAPGLVPGALNGEYRIEYSGISGAGALLRKHGPFTPTIGLCNNPHYGASLAVIGDLNGDGHPEIAVGAPDWDFGTCQGDGIVEIVDVWAGTLMATITIPSGFPWNGTSTCFTSILGTAFGFALAGVGDLDSDGYPDLVVGAPGASAVFTYSGASLQPGFAPVVTSYSYVPPSVVPPSPPIPYAHGYSLASIGDLDSDGVRDFVVGVPSYLGNAGTVLTYSGQAAIFAAGGSITTIHPASSLYLGSTVGTTVARVRDMDADGIQDYIVGAGSAAGPGVGCNPNGSTCIVFSGGTANVISQMPSTNPMFANVIYATGNLGSALAIPSIMVSDYTAQLVQIKNP